MDPNAVDLRSCWIRHAERLQLLRLDDSGRLYSGVTEVRVDPTVLANSWDSLAHEAEDEGYGNSAGGVRVYLDSLLREALRGLRDPNTVVVYRSDTWRYFAPIDEPDLPQVAGWFFRPPARG